MNALNGAERRRTGERKLACTVWRAPLAQDVGYARVGAAGGREGYQLLLLLLAVSGRILNEARSREWYERQLRANK